MPRQQAAGHDATPPMISRKASKAYGAGHNLRHYVKTTRFQDAVADISDNARAAYVLKDQGELWRTCWCACGAALAGAIAEVGYLDMHGDGAGCGGALWSILGGRPLDVGPEVSGRGNCCQGWVVPNCGDVRCFRLCLQLVMRVSFLSFLYFTYFGMLAMALSPNMQAATILSSSFFILFTLLSGFIIPKPEVQHGGHGSIGLSTTWTLQGLIVTQYGSGFGDQQIRDYVLKHFGYKEDFNGIMIAVLLGRDSKKNDMTTIPRVKQSMTGLRGRRWRPWEKEEGRKLWEQGREKAGGGEEGGGGGDGNKDGNGLKGGSGGKGKGSDGGGGDGW
ncbi:hypothetical protein HPP92_024137 [Vanilla planifolia]|uniref:ABC-2 type transporter transmembrane domain-containing protein n=1 Tax=Vanilla planifolia TaxID=51239 RepID=A0A835PMZ5_VANPL|nr:hypothetical protein HPP92_024137 [Vanilla planifolia]